jgi:hypothetical protein
MLTLNKMAGMDLNPVEGNTLIDVPLPGGEGYMIAVLHTSEDSTTLLEYLPGGVRIINFYPVPLDAVKNLFISLVQDIGFSEFTVEENLRKMLQQEATQGEVPEA